MTATKVRIKPVTINGATIGADDINGAIDELASAYRISRREADALVLSHTSGPRTEAQTWCTAIAEAIEQKGVPITPFGLEEYQLTAPGNSDVPRESVSRFAEADPAEIDAECSRILADAGSGKANRSMSTALLASSVSSVRSSFAPDIQLSGSQRERLFDSGPGHSSDPEAEILRLTSGKNAAWFGTSAQDSAPEHDEVARLTAQHGQFFGLAQGGVPATDDVNVPVASDTSMQTVYKPYASPVTCDNGHLVTSGSASYCPDCGAKLDRDNDDAATGENPPRRSARPLRSTGWAAWPRRSGTTRQSACLRLPRSGPQLRPGEHACGASPQLAATARADPG